MKKKSKTLVFFGNERILTGVDFSNAPIFSALIKNNYTILAVFLENKETKSRKPKTNMVAEIAEKNGIPVYNSLSTEEIVTKIKDLNPDLGILVSYGKLLKTDIIDMLPYGIINVHPSALPKYRGTTPIETAILNGDSQIGVSIMKLTEGMDSGPVYAQKSFSIDIDDTKIEIAQKALELAANLIIEVLPDILSGKISPFEQIDSLATYTKKINKTNAIIDPGKDSSIKIFNTIKSMYGYPKAKIVFQDKIIIVNKAHISDTAQLLSFRCKDNKYIVIDNLTTTNGKTMSSEQFIHGHRK